MAQAIVQSSWARLKSAIEDGVTRRWNFTSDLEEMLKALEAVKPLLHDAESRSLRRKHPEPEVREWVGRVRKNAYSISDMVDELQETRRRSPAAGKVTAILPCLRKRNQMADNMNQTMEELRKLVQESGTFGLTPSEPTSDPVIDLSAVGEEKIVGRDEEIKTIVAACDTSDGPAIIPIDGVGRTAFARMVFNHTRFRHHSRVWVTVLQEYSLHDIGNSIISQLSGGVESSNQEMEYITKRLHELLQDCSTKVLVVLDDLRLATEDCSQFNRMFGVGDKSSKVTAILMTRYMVMLPMQLTRLSEDMCWTIIKQSSGFEGRPESDKKNLEQIGRKIAEKCYNCLPSETKLLGAMLRYKDATGWEEVPSSVFWDEYSMELMWTFPVLNVAYSMMPSNLRLCYAYCAIFPKGHTIVKDCLIHQWIALGLIEPSDRFSTMQLAEEYIRSLVDLSLLQIIKPDSTSANDGKGSVLYSVHKVHLFHPEEVQAGSYYVQGLNDEFIRLKETCSQEYARYAVLTDFDTRPLELWCKLLPQLRAIHSVGGSKMEFGDDLFSSARWLRVLELKEHSMPKLPESVCQLRHLRCLNLSGCCGLETLPESFGDLLNLVYIDLSRCSKLKSLPKSLGKKLAYLVYIDLSSCYALVTLPESFGKLINLEHVGLSGCCGLESLPRSFGKLIKLPHINLSGCSSLKSLPESFGKLIKLPHINLSGCSSLESLPESFGELTSLVRVDLSGCSGLLSLPQSFGNLINLLYIDLSRCHALVDLPRSFMNLKKLQHLNLSFWSCCEVITKALGGLTSLQHLDLSHPCSSKAQHLQHQHLQGLQEALKKLTSLQYLNLSMFFHCQSDQEEVHQFISVLPNLEHLDLSHNMFLRAVPESLAGLSKLHTLDLTGCIRLKTVPKRIYEMECLKLIVLRHCRCLESYQLAVGRGNLVQLEDVNCQEMEISCLEKVKTVDEARSVRFREKGHRMKLKLCWTPGSQRSMGDNALLGEVVPPHGLQSLELRGYWGAQTSCLCHMGWWVQPPRIGPNLLNLEEITLDNVQTCVQLPPVGLLPNLQRLVLTRITTITRIDARDMCFRNWPALRRLSKLTINDMPNLEAFNTRYDDGVDGAEELMFPAVDELSFTKCPLLVFVPLPPRAWRLKLIECDKVMSASWWTGAGRGVEGPPCTDAAPVVTELVVESCSVMLSDWNLLHHLHGLRSLTIDNCSSTVPNKRIRRSSMDSFPAALSSLQILCFSRCNQMTLLPKILGDFNSLRELWINDCRSLIRFGDRMQKLTTLEAIHINSCRAFRELSEWLGDLTSLKKLAIHCMYHHYSLPNSIGKLANLKDLYISECPSLQAWCEQEPNKKILDHIRPKYEKCVSPMPGTQPLQNDDPHGDTSKIGRGNETGGDDSTQRQPILAPLGPPQRDIYLT